MSKRKTPSKSTSKKRTQPRRKAEKVGGPFLAYAVLCERVLNEKDNVQSLIRVFDRVTPRIREGKSIPKEGLVLPLVLTVAFKSVEFVGTKNVTVEVSGRRKCPIPETAIQFEGRERGPVVTFEMAFAMKESELVWFEVKLDGKTMTRVPLRVHFPSTKEENTAKG